MKKTLLLVLAMLMALTPFASAEGNSEQMADAVKSFQAFELNGEKVEIGGYLINGNNYYKLRDVAALLNSTTGKFDVKYENKKISLKTGEAYEKLETDLQPMKHDKTKAKMVTNKIMVDGKDVELNAAFIDNNNYVKLRDLGAVVGLEVDFKDGTIIVNTKAEGKTEENIEEKKEEKKDEAKSTDPNATLEEIKAFLADVEKAKKVTLEGKSIVKEGDKLYLVIEDSKTPVSRYEFFDKEENKKRIEAQSSFLATIQSLYVSSDVFVNNYFIKADRLGRDSVEILSIINDLNYTTDNGQILGIDFDKDHMIAPLSDGSYKEFGQLVVAGIYSDGSDVVSTEKETVYEVPLIKKGSTAKLIKIIIITHLNNGDQEFINVNII